MDFKDKYSQFEERLMSSEKEYEQKKAHIQAVWMERLGNLKSGYEQLIAKIKSVGSLLISGPAEKFEDYEDESESKGSDSNRDRDCELQKAQSEDEEKDKLIPRKQTCEQTTGAAGGYIPAEVEELEKKIDENKKELERRIDIIGDKNQKVKQALNGIKHDFDEEVGRNKTFQEQMSHKMDDNSRLLLGTGERLDTCCVQMEEKSDRKIRKKFIPIGIVMCILASVFLVYDRFFFAK